MSYRFNPFTGTLDLVGDSNFDTILTGPSFYESLTVLIDHNGNVLTES